MKRIRRVGALWEEKIEQLLKQAHEVSKRDKGEVDLIEEYFIESSSLDHITRKAYQLLQIEKDPSIRETVCKNLTDCILAKMDKERRSWFFLVRKLFVKLGWIPQLSREVRRAENVLREFYLDPEIKALS